MQEKGLLATLARLIPYAGKTIPRLMLGVVVGIAAHMFALALPQVLRELVNGLEQNRSLDFLLASVGLFLLFGASEAVLVLLRRWLVLEPGTQVEARMRNHLYEKLQQLPVSFHDQWPSGQLLSRSVQDLGLLRRWISFGFVLLIANISMIAVGLVILFNTHWMLGAILLVSSLPFWMRGFNYQREYGMASRQSQDQAGDLATSVEESVHGIRVLKAFGRGDQVAGVFSKEARELRMTELRKARLNSNLWLFIILLPELSIGLSLLAGVYLISSGDLTIGGLVSYFATVMVLRWPIESLGFLLAFTLDAKAAVQRFVEVIDKPIDIAEQEKLQHIENPAGKLEFKDVHFRYADAPKNQSDLIDGVSFAVQPGESVAIIGVTGSGKSTLTSLSTRLYDVTSGSIEIDGVDIRNLSFGELRSLIAMAFEDATLFSASVRDNVLLGRPDASEQDLKQAIEIAQAHFVYDLPEGVETVIGEEGLSLSGGQRQRLALARAVAAKPSILVMDDPLSALDVDTEALVEGALRQVLAGTTALIVAHRPSTVMLADKVALMENGKITEFGTHSELLKSSDHYRYVISSFDEEKQVII
jgi:ATP-binding cassette subfamily B protein